MTQARNFHLGGVVRPCRILYIYANAVGLADLSRFGRIQKWKRPDQYILDVKQDEDLDKVAEYVNGEEIKTVKNSLIVN